MNYLNKEQQKAVYNTDGPMLIIAGPGSGKTHTLVERVVYLISEKKIKPNQLMVSTFTEKAAAELITRISNKLLENNIRINLNEMYIGTLHSICLSILDENREFTRLKRSYSVLDQFEQAYFLFQKISEFQEIENSNIILGEVRRSRWRQAQRLLGWLNKVSEEAIDIKKLIKSDDKLVVVLGECYKLYQEKLIEENTLDFSTIQYETLKLFEDNREILSKYQESIKYLMIDEYQDTNTVQEAILFQLANKHNNICVVGDDDQALYRFRGATVRNILEFPSHFEKVKCKKVKLSTNYRSHKGIIDYYNNWMNRDEWWVESKYFRHEKSVMPQMKKFHKYNSVIKVSSKESVEDWSERITQFLLDLKNKNILTDWNQAAFLFRSVKHRHVRALSDYLEESGIPVYSPRSNLFFDREEVKLIVGALVFLFPQFPIVREMHYNNPLPIWDYYDDCLKYFFTQVKEPENENLLNWCKPKRVIHEQLGSNTDYAYSGLFYELIQFPLFSKYLDTNGNVGIQDTRAARNLALFSKLLTKFEYIYNITVFTPKYLENNIWDFFNHYFRFLHEGGIGEYEDEAEYAPSGCVSFMTIHQSKGLEFPIVLVDSLYVIPRKQYSDLDVILQNNYYRKPIFEPIEQTKFFDFWRLYYTAFSRAENLLVLTCYEKETGRRVPSKYFIDYYKGIIHWEDIRDKFPKIKLSEIKETNIKPTYSFTSHITVYENCALQYKFYKDFEFTPVRRGAMMFGILVHETIEDVHTAALTGNSDKITEDNISDWFNRNYLHLSHRQREYLAPQTQQAALKQILNYVKRNNNWSHLKEAEVDVSLLKDDYILKGTIDLIKGDNDTVEIVDFKSEKKPDLVTEKERIEQYKRQLEVYAHLVEERTGEEVSKLHIYYTGEDNGNPYISFNRDSESINSTIEEFDRVVNNIEKKNYNIAERPRKLCLNCDMRFYCERNC